MAYSETANKGDLQRLWSDYFLKEKEIYAQLLKEPDTVVEGTVKELAGKYGIDIMEQMGIPVKKIHAGHANMFLSSIFRDTLAGVTGATIELYDTDGSVGAAKGAGIGAGIYKDNNEAFATLDKLDVIEPNIAKRQEYADAYARWKYNINNDIITF